MDQTSRKAFRKSRRKFNSDRAMAKMMRRIHAASDALQDTRRMNRDVLLMYGRDDVAARFYGDLDEDGQG